MVANGEESGHRGRVRRSLKMTRSRRRVARIRLIATDKQDDKQRSSVHIRRMSLYYADYRIDLPTTNVIVLALFIAQLVVTVTALVRIAQRAGYSGWWVLILLVPIANLLAFWYFAFGEWPATKPHRESQT